MSATAVPKTATVNSKTREVEFGPDLSRSDLIDQGRDLIGQARARLVEASRSGSGRPACLRYARFFDALLRALYRHLTKKRETDGKGSQGSLCLVALGGYGRRDLSLHSDIDLLFVIGEKREYQKDFIKDFLHVLFDWKLEVGYSTRKISDCLGMVHNDLESTTAMLESHYLAGSRPLFQKYHEDFYRVARGWGRRWFLQAKSAEWNSRHAKYDTSVYLLEPNLKEGTGGLRDLHSVRWTLMVLEGSPELSALLKTKILTEAELHELRRAEEFILKLRNELHSLLPRKSDLLNFESQVAIAKNLDYKEREGFLPAEVLMREYYRHARTVAKLTSRIFHTLLRRERSGIGSVIGSLKKKRVTRQLSSLDGVLFVEDKKEGYFKKDPTRILELFCKARKLGLRVSERTRDRIEKVVPDLGEAFAEDPKNIAHFMELMTGPEGVADTLSDMHECGVLCAFVPEFENVRHMVRMDHYHRYTVDEHLIHAVGMTEKLLFDPPDSMEHARRVLREISRLDLLNLALLLHDVGKGRGKGHALIGSQLIQRVGLRFGLPAEDVETLRFLVIAHLKISHVAQRRDLDDPQVAAEMAVEIGSIDYLDLLYVHSLCDLSAVSPDAMSQWKARLYQKCYEVTAAALRGVDTAPENDSLGRKAMLDSVWKLLDVDSLLGETDGESGEEKLRRKLGAFVEDVPERYVRSTPVAIIAEHFSLTQRLDLKNTIEWALHSGPGVSELVVCSNDLPGAFALTCGALMAKGVNIGSAQIFSTSDGYAINRFQVTDLNDKPLPAGFRLERLRKDLNRVFLDRLTIEELIDKYRQQVSRQRWRGIRRPSEVRFDNNGSTNFTIAEIRTADHPGLLYEIATVFDRNKLNIHRAMLNTEAYGVMDVFYLTDLEYNKIHDEGRMDRIKAELIQVLDEGGAGAAGGGNVDNSEVRGS